MSIIMIEPIYLIMVGVVVYVLLMIGILSRSGLMPNAAKHLLNASEERIQSLAHDILLAQLRRLLATTSMEGFSAFRNKFLDTLQENVEAELNKLGLHIVSIDLTQIRVRH